MVTMNFLVDKSIVFSNDGRWIDFNAIFALHVYGIMLFPSMEDFVGLTTVHIFLSKNSVPTLLANTYYSIHTRSRKKNSIIVCCVPLLYW